MNEPLNQQPNAPFSAPPPAANNNDRIMAIISLVLGVINLCLWLVPILTLCSFPVGIAGIILGYLGRRDVSQRTIATIGMALSALSLVLACALALYNIWVAASSGNLNF